MLIAGTGVSSRLTGALSSSIPSAARSVARPLGLCVLLVPSLGVDAPDFGARAIFVFGLGDAVGVLAAGFGALLLAVSTWCGWKPMYHVVQVVRMRENARIKCVNTSLSVKNHYGRGSFVSVS